MGQDPPYDVQTASAFPADPNRPNRVRGLRHTPYPTRRQSPPLT
ncbi:restriction endonuclease [Neisseria bacilliformis ATCC BAA-1200]|uniref:Restriction endonuclease n=1 Tax=Neisseria bacilliformis ATCC BAA-1200 TaxID=888742 RepID=F2BG48_9NEIS|nr:restriction endonuclease [Neisseria bacilliformis ATCC BAA-1200]